ncbi:general stress protein [Actinotalea sp. Marseille-Q4924]|uniref:general stress protein n=1 Tax=Actinotalea sp. Marseille-Q4924 TaxID=2866571 RepID=UPI001CE3E59D|nr:general stress protein [Actinotalea sp. Marseille-Q4924]
MSLSRSTRPPAVPTPPRGEQIASYDTYLEAQKAVDHLSDKEFAVQHVTIVGTDLRMVERVTGRLTYSRVALAGLASGAWFGLFVGLLLSFFAAPTGGGSIIFPAIAIGAAFGILFSVISYAFTGGKRDFTSASQIVASQYAVLCEGEHAHKARGLLAELGGGRPWPPPQQPTSPHATTQHPPTAQPTVPQQPPTPASSPEQPPAAPPAQPPADPRG